MKDLLLVLHIFKCSKLFGNGLQLCNKEFGQKVNLVGHLQSKHKLSEEQAKNGIIELNEHVPKNQPAPAVKVEPEEPSTTLVKIENSTTPLADNNKKIFKCMECLFDSEDSGDMISHHLSKHVQPMPMFSFDTSDLSLE